jgi:integrase
MSQRTRYQEGNIVRIRRSRVPDYWALRWWDSDAEGKRVRRKAVIGPVSEYPTEASARKAAEALRMTINEASPKVTQRPISVSALIKHYIEHELCAGDEEEAKSFATQRTNQDFLRLYITPQWGNCKLREVRSVAVEKWLKNFTKENGEPYSRPTKAKIRNIMSAVFNHAIRYEFLPQGKNPITLVRQSAKRMRVPDVLDAKEVTKLFAHLSQRDQVMVLLDATTGLRRSELIGLKWSDVDFEQLELSVTRSVYQSVVGRCKTEASRKPVPLDPWVAEELLMWKRSAPYNQPDDWIFASPRTKGKKPYQPDMILQRGIRPAAVEAGITKRIGWHTFRHTFSTLLKASGVDVKVMQELLRHANSRITLDIYTQAMSPEKRKAQTRVVKMFLKRDGKKSPKTVKGGKLLLDPKGPQ